MCYSAKSSLRAYLASNAIGLATWFAKGRNDPFVASELAFLSTFTLVQLIEYHIWNSLYEGNQKKNSRWTRLLRPALWLQPAVHTFGTWYTGGGLGYGMLSGVYGLFALRDICVSRDPTAIGEYGHLVWSFVKERGQAFDTDTQGYFYMFGMLAPLVSSLPRSWPHLTFGTSSIIVSRLVASPREFSSMWCYVAVLYSLVIAVF